MKTLKQSFLGIFFSLVLAVSFASAQLSPGGQGSGGLTPSALCNRGSGVWTFCTTTDDFGSSTSKIDVGHFTTLNATTFTAAGDTDLNGNKIVFDADADTYAQATEDDVIHWTIGGTEVVSFSTDGVSLSNNKIIFDTDSDTWARTILDDSLVFAAGGTQVVTMSADGVMLNKHLEFDGTAPSVGSGAGDCGTTPSIVGNDNVGRVTVGGVANGGKCTVTFAVAWTNAPICVVEEETTANLVRPANVTTTAVEITGTLVAGDKLAYQCFGYR